jgi:hypothetical protein
MMNSTRSEAVIIQGCFVQLRKLMPASSQSILRHDIDSAYTQPTDRVSGFLMYFVESSDVQLAINLSVQIQPVKI